MSVEDRRLAKLPNSIHRIQIVVPVDQKCLTRQHDHEGLDVLLSLDQREYFKNTLTRLNTATPPQALTRSQMHGFPFVEILPVPKRVGSRKAPIEVVNARLNIQYGSYLAYFAAAQVLSGILDEAPVRPVINWAYATLYLKDILIDSSSDIKELEERKLQEHAYQEESDALDTTFWTKNMFRGKYNTGPRREYNLSRCRRKQFWGGAKAVELGR